MARPRPVARLALAAVGVGAGWSAGACTRCDVDCTAPSRVEEVVAEVRGTEPGVVQVRTEAGDLLDVRVFGGSPDDLEDGRSYRFPLLFLAADPDPAAPADAPAVEPVAFFPDDCDCTADYISELDGSVVDPGVDVPFRRLAISFIAAALVGTIGWAMARWYREVPL